MTHLGQRLSALIDGELDGAERDRVLVHLARCEPCRGEAIALRMLKRRMNALGEAAADSTLTGRLMGLAQPQDPALWQHGRAPVTPWSSLGLAAQGPGRGGYEIRPSWYLAAGSFGVLVAGLAAAAFLAGGPQQPPVPRVTPAVYLYQAQHAIDTGVVPATTSGSGGGSWSPAGQSTASHAP
jgi:anti-sigma factor RsiW